MSEPIYETPGRHPDPRRPARPPRHAAACSRPSSSCASSSATRSRSSARPWARGRSATTPSASSRSCSCRSTIRPRRSSCLDRLKEATIVFGKAQIEAGADALTLPDHATGDLVSGDYYRRYLRDLHIEFAEELDAPIILHICGRTVDRMGYIAETGMAAFHYDSKNGAGRVDGRGRRAHQPRRQHQQPRDAVLARARPRCATRSARTSRPASRWSARSARSPCRRRIENLLRDRQRRRRVARRAAPLPRELANG